MDRIEAVEKVLDDLEKNVNDLREMLRRFREPAAPQTRGDTKKPPPGHPAHPG